MKTIITTVLPVVQAVTSPPIITIREYPSVHSPLPSTPVKRRQATRDKIASDTPVKRIRVTIVTIPENKLSVKTSSLQNKKDSETPTVHMEQQHVLDVNRAPDVTIATFPSPVITMIPFTNLFSSKYQKRRRRNLSSSTEISDSLLMEKEKD